MPAGDDDRRDIEGNTGWLIPFKPMTKQEINSALASMEWTEDEIEDGLKVTWYEDPEKK